MFEIAEDDNKSVFFTSYTTVMSIATSNAWISNAMQMLRQTSTELYNHTVNVALLTACIVREDDKRSYNLNSPLNYNEDGVGNSMANALKISL